MHPQNASAALTHASSLGNTLNLNLQKRLLLGLNGMEKLVIARTRSARKREEVMGTICSASVQGDSAAVGFYSTTVPSVSLDVGLRFGGIACPWQKFVH